jgi:hypothetical protein
MLKQKVVVLHRINKIMKKKKIKKSQSASYGSMTFWKNVDFWESVLLYVGMIVLFYCFGMLAGFIQ